MDVWEVRAISAFMEISFPVADSTKNVLGETPDPKIAWGTPKRFSAKQGGLHSALISQLQLAAWDGAIHTHRDSMVDLRL